MELKKLSILLVVLLILQGCASNTPDAPGANSDISGKTLTVVSPFGEGDGYMSVYQELIASFEADTQCTVEDTSEHSSEQWKLDVMEKFSKGEEPDVLFFFTGAAVDELIAQGKLVDLNTIREYDPDYTLNINSIVLSTMTQKDGLNYCVPVTGFWEGLYINQDLFDTYSVTVPTTMSELSSAIDKFNAAGIVPISANLKSTPHYWFEYMMYSYTGPLEHNGDISDARLRESMSRALDALKILYDAGAFPEDIEDITDAICADLFAEKKAAMLLDGSWAGGSIPNKDDVKVIHLPAPNDAARQSTDIISGFSMGYYITQKGWENNREASVAFVKAMTDENALTLFNKGGSASPGATATTEDTTPYLESVSEFINSATAFAPALQDSFSKEARDYLFSQVLNILQGTANADDVLDEFFVLNNAT